jgi:hypothetical protein
MTEIHKNIILPVFYMHVEVCLVLREGHRLRMFENRMLRRIFGPKGEKVVGGWRRLHNEELHNLYTSPYIITMIISRRMRWVGHVAFMGEMINA